MEVPSIFLNRVLMETAKKNAQSVHIVAGSYPIIRLDNSLFELEGESIASVEMIEKILTSFLNEEEKAAFRHNKEIVVMKTFAGSFRFRVGIFLQKGLPSLSFHYIPEKIMAGDELGLPPILQNLVKLNSGLFVITGSRQSGKTATAAALIEEVNKTAKKRIITIENPIEYMFISKKSLIEQRQVGRDVASIEQGIVHAQEEGADCVYIGEARESADSFAARMLELAAGNALVIYETNSDNSKRVLEKIIAAAGKSSTLEAARYALSDVLVGVISQRLFPRRGGGLALAAEVLLVNSPVKALIREGKVSQLESIMQTSRREGMISLEKAIEELVANGVVKREDAEDGKLGTV